MRALNERLAEARQERERWTTAIARIDAQRASLEAAEAANRRERLEVALAAVAGDDAATARLKVLSVAGIETASLLDALAAARQEADREVAAIDELLALLQHEQEAERAVALLPALQAAAQVVDRAAAELAANITKLLQYPFFMKDGGERDRLWPLIVANSGLEEVFRRLNEPHRTSSRSPEAIADLVEERIARHSCAHLEEMRRRSAAAADELAARSRQDRIAPPASDATRRWPDPMH